MNIRKSFYFCGAFQKSAVCRQERQTGYSAVRLAHLVWDQRAASSNLATPTQESPAVTQGFIFSTGLNVQNSIPTDISIMP